MPAKSGSPVAKIVARERFFFFIVALLVLAVSLENPR